MKAKIARGLHWLRTGFVASVRRHPVEAGLALYECIACILNYELDRSDDAYRLFVVPLFFFFTLAVNNLAGFGPWRKVYWVSWTPVVPLLLWNGLAVWLETETAAITCWILLPLALLLSRRATRNGRFVSETIVYLRAAVLALFFANVAMGLFYAIFYSTVYIFGLDGPWIGDVSVYVVILTESLAVPLLFLMMFDRWADGECRGMRILEVLLNYVVSPALVIYAAILYLYMARILLTWTLPEGGVAYLVFGFTMVALLVQALQSLLQKRIYDWFFDRFSLVSLPMLVLFWIGVLRRTGEYGMTAPRVYLVVCGGLMTLCVLLFLTRRTGRYYLIALTGFVVFAALAYVPGLEPHRIAMRSQAARAVRIARELGRLDAEGRVLLTPVPMADTVHYRRYHQLYEALDLLESADDTLRMRRRGLPSTDAFIAAFPEPFSRMVRTGYRWDGDTAYRNFSAGPPSNYRVHVGGEYPELYLNLTWYGSDRSYEYADDSLHIYLGREKPLWSISGEELFRRQCERSGYDPASGLDPTAEQRAAMTDYRDERCRIFFRDLTFNDADGEMRLRDVSIEALMLR